MMFKIVLIACIACIFALSFKKINESVSVAILIAGTVILAVFIITHFVGAFNGMSEMVSATGINSSYLKILFKCLGISFVACIAADICEDAGYTALVSQIMLAGKVSVLLLCLPLFEAVLKMCIGIIRG